MKFFHLMLLCVIFLFGCDKENPLIKTVAELEKAPNKKTIRLSTVTDFEWDTLFVYGPYYPVDEIYKKHGAVLRNSADYGYISEGYCVYIFVKEEQLVKTFEHARDKVDCAEIDNLGVFEKENAIFSIRGNGHDFPKLEWIGSREVK